MNDNIAERKDNNSDILNSTNIFIFKQFLCI